MQNVNYTPISLVSINAKIVYKILASRIQSCIKIIMCSEQVRSNHDHDVMESINKINYNCRITEKYL